MKFQKSSGTGIYNFEEKKRYKHNDRKKIVCEIEFNIQVDLMIFSC